MNQMDRVLTAIRELNEQLEKLRDELDIADCNNPHESITIMRQISFKVERLQALMEYKTKLGGS